jgi:integrase
VAVISAMCRCGILRNSIQAVIGAVIVKVTLDETPARLDTRPLFPGPRGGHLNLKEWRDRDEWSPALRAAGVAHRGPYALRHTYAAFSIAAGVSLYEIARFMGTSVEQIDRTYGHLLPDSIDRTRASIDAFVERARSSTEAQPSSDFGLVDL